MKPHLFNPLVAKELNIECAVILYNMEFWIAKNEANETHFYDGKYWTYNSIEAFTKLFPYMTKKVIYTSLQKLINSGYLIKGCFNENNFNQTRWYALGEKRSEDLDYSNFHKGNIHFPYRENPQSHQGKSYNSNTDINYTDINKEKEKNTKKEKDKMASNESIASYKSKDDDIDLNSSAESLGNLESPADSVLESAATKSDQNQSEQCENQNIVKNELKTPQKSKNGNEVIPNYTITPKIDLKGKSKALTKITDKSQIDNEFELLWSLYPRSENKANAKRAFIQLRAGKHKNHQKIQVPFDNILNALSELLAKIARDGTDKQWIPYCSSWLNANDFIANNVDNNNTKLPQDSSECLQEIKAMLMRMADKMNEKFKENPEFKSSQEYPIIRREILTTCLLKIKEICNKYKCSFYKYYGVYADELPKDELKYRWYLCKSFHEWLKESLNG